MDIERNTDRDFALWALIIQARDLLFKARDDELNQYGITAVEARALFIIHLIGEQATPAMISRWMLREHNTVTALLTRMEHKGLITRAKDPDKKNSWRIGLTTKGEKAYQNSQVRDALRRILSVLDDSERETTIKALQKISDQTFRYLAGVPEKE